MLSAESVALQTRLVNQLASLRRQELDYIMQRYASLGTQSALIASFILGTWQNTYELPGLDAKVASRTILRVFYVSTYVAALSCMAVIIATTFITNWAPDVALNGASGSVSRALDAARAPREVINGLFVCSIGGFVSQLLMTVWMLAFTDDSAADFFDALINSVVIGAFVLFSLRLVVKIHADFYGNESEPCPPVVRQLLPACLLQCFRPAGYFRRRDASEVHDDKLKPLLAAVDHRLDNPLSLVAGHPDLDHSGAAAAENFSLALSRDTDGHDPALCAMAGPLRKKTSPRAPGSSRLLERAGASGTQWRERFFVLTEGTLLYWQTEVDFQQFVLRLEPAERQKVRGAPRVMSAARTPCTMNTPCTTPRAPVRPCACVLSRARHARLAAWARARAHRWSSPRMPAPRPSAPRVRASARRRQRRRRRPA